MKRPIHLRLFFCLLFLPALACGIPATQSPQAADPNAFNTQVAQTAAAQNSDPSAFNTAIAQTADGKWIIVHTGQSWPPCAAIQPYNFPLDYVSHCEDANGNVVDRAGGESSAPPSNPTPASPLQADSFAPDPLGAAWTGFWIAQGECYDLDLFSAVNDATCDLRLEADNTFTPQNGAAFEAAFYQTAPSLGTCKSASFSGSPINALNTTYVCFQTNTGKYGFLLPREIQAGGIVFDAYLFP